MNETFNDALIDVVKCCGGSKALGALMRPEISADDAGKWLRDCLNPARREVLSPEWVLWLLRAGRERQCHAAMDFLGLDVGYTVTAIEPEDERTAVMREFNVAMGIVARIATRAERAGLLPAELDAKGARR